MLIYEDLYLNFIVYAFVCEYVCLYVYICMDIIEKEETLRCVLLYSEIMKM